MSQKLIEIAKVFQTPLKLNAKAGDSGQVWLDDVRLCGVE